MYFQSNSSIIILNYSRKQFQQPMRLFHFVKFTQRNFSVCCFLETIIRFVPPFTFPFVLMQFLFLFLQKILEILTTASSKSPLLLYIKMICCLLLLKLIHHLLPLLKSWVKSVNFIIPISSVTIPYTRNIIGLNFS
jgi:hypothetical protein